MRKNMFKTIILGLGAGGILTPVNFLIFLFLKNKFKISKQIIMSTLKSKTAIYIGLVSVAIGIFLSIIFSIMSRPKVRSVKKKESNNSTSALEERIKELEKKLEEKEDENEKD